MFTQQVFKISEETLEDETNLIITYGQETSTKYLTIIDGLKDQRPAEEKEKRIYQAWLVTNEKPIKTFRSAGGVIDVLEKV